MVIAPDTRVRDLWERGQLSHRAYISLVDRFGYVVTVADVRARSRGQLFSCCGLGRTTLREIEDTLGPLAPPQRRAPIVNPTPDRLAWWKTIQPLLRSVREREQERP